MSESLFTYIAGNKSTVYTEIPITHMDVLAVKTDTELDITQSYSEVKKSHHKEQLLRHTPVFTEYKEMPAEYVDFIDGLIETYYSLDDQTQLVEVCSNLVHFLTTSADINAQLFEQVYSIIPFETEVITEYIISFTTTDDTPVEIYVGLAFYAAYYIDSKLYELEQSDTTDQSDTSNTDTNSNAKFDGSKDTISSTRRSTEEFKIEVDDDGSIDRQEEDSTLHDDREENDMTESDTTDTNLDDINEPKIESENGEILLLTTFDLTEYETLSTHNEFIELFFNQTAPALTELSGFKAYTREVISLALVNGHSFTTVMKALLDRGNEETIDEYHAITNTYSEIYTNIFLHLLETYLTAYLDKDN